MYERVRAYVKKYHMLQEKDHVIAGVSGGADSVCLLFMLVKLQKEMRFGLTVVHIHHGLRGESADADENYVRALCEKLDVELLAFHEDVGRYAKEQKMTLEEAGRNVRRHIFEEVCHRKNGTRIALAHHQNDNAETLLMNLSRGTGLTGLGGIRPVNGVFIRPLLCLSREEIESFLKERNQDFCTDATNADTEYTRNKIRHLIVPVLEKQVNSQTVRHMNETIEQVWELQDYMELQAKRAFEECVTMIEQAGEVICLIREMQWYGYPDILKKMIIRRCLCKVSGETQDIGQVHINAISELFQKQSGRCLDLPYSVKALRRYEGVQIQTAAYGGADTQKNSPIELQIPGVTFLPDRNLRIDCEIFAKKDGFSFQDIPQKPYTKWFDYDIIKKALFIRTRQSGDSIVIDKGGHRKKLKSWFINEKIPAEERKKQLLIAEEDQVVWIVGHRMSSAYQVKENTQKILQIRVTEEKKDVRDN